MSVQMIQQRLLSYSCKTDIEEQQAIREITQEVVLAALGRGDFFKYALLLTVAHMAPFRGRLKGATSRSA